VVLYFETVNALYLWVKKIKRFIGSNRKVMVSLNYMVFGKMVVARAYAVIDKN